jgi:hypothetical protein
MRCRCSLHVLLVLLSFFALTGVAEASSGVLVGNSSISGSTYSQGTEWAQAFEFTAAASGPAASASVYVDSGSSATSLVAGLYNTAWGHPSQLLAYGRLSSPKPGAWNTINLSSSPSVSSSQTYWIAVLATGGALTLSDSSGSWHCSEYPSQTNLTSLPANWPSGSGSSACSLSAYVSSSAPSSPSSPVSAPSSTSSPAIRGTAQEGDTLTTSNGSWSGSPTSYAYQWEDCNTSGGTCVSISGATGSTYTLAASDVGSTIRSVVMATNAGGSSSASSAATSTVSMSGPSNTTAPAVSGQTVQGDTLSTSNGGWSGSPTAYGYQWQDCNSSGGSCVGISGATGSSYTLTSSDVGSTIRSAVTATNAGGSSSASSAATSPVSMSGPSNTTAPAISGTAQEGRTLSTSNGGWSGSPSGFAYGWEDCGSSGGGCVGISGASGSSYTLTGSDVGSTIRSVVTATNEGGSSASSSAATSVVGVSAPSSTSVPVVTGQAVQGQTLSTSNGGWSGSPSGFGYQWEDCNSSGAGCVGISGATGSSYTLAGSDVGSTIRSVVTATNAGGSSSASSAATASVAAAGGGGPAPVNTVAPYFCGVSSGEAANGGGVGGCSAVTGDAVQGQTLTVGTGAWTNSPSSFGYQWEDCATADGQPPTTGSCSPIAGATSSSYTVKASDVGKALVPIVTASNGSSASTTVSGSCDAGSTTYVSSSGGSVSADPSIGAGCSPISAVAGTTTGTGSGAMEYCTNAPVTCGLADPLSGNAGVPPGTTLSSGSIPGSCSGTYKDLYITTSITLSSGTCTIEDSRIVGSSGLAGGQVVTVEGATVTFLHDDMSGYYSGASSATTGTGEAANVSAQCSYTSSGSGGSAAYAVVSPGSSGFTANNSYAHCAEEPINGPTTLETTYGISDEQWSGTHNEAIYSPGGVGYTFENDVILNPWSQTAGLFTDCKRDGPPNGAMVTNNLAATYGSNGALGVQDGTNSSCDNTTPSNITVDNNRYSHIYNTSMPCGYANGTGVTYTGNITDDTDTSMGTKCG